MKSNRGENLVEVAVLLPVLLLILAGMVDLGRGLQAYTIITNAAREGARYGCMYPEDSIGIQQHAINEAAGSGIDLTPSNIHISSSSSGNPISVTVTYDLPLITELVAGGGTLQMQSSVEMIIY